MQCINIFQRGLNANDNVFDEAFRYTLPVNTDFNPVYLYDIDWGDGTKTFEEQPTEFKTYGKTISHAYENLSEDEKNNIVNDMWINYGLTFAEYLFMSKFNSLLSPLWVKQDSTITKQSTYGSR